MKILIVDDEPSLQKSCKLMLEKRGHVVGLADNGNRALSALSGESYDLLITDIIMPDKEGIELIIEVRGQYPSLPIIAMSGGGRLDAHNYLDMAAKLGCTTTLQKPFTFDELLAAVDAAASLE